MPSIAPPPLAKWERPSKTTEQLDWADIKVIDISRFEEPGEKQRLAEELRDAVCTGPNLLQRVCLSLTLWIGSQDGILQHNGYRVDAGGGGAPV